MKDINFKDLEQSPHLLDILIQMEDVLDSLDVYVYKNWIDGEVVSGPDVRRHWLSMSLLYPLDKMPDTRAGMRLIKHGIRVDFSKISREGEEPRDKENPETGEEKTHWLVRLDFPRRLVAQMNGVSELEMYDDLVDVDDVESAKDSGVTDETGVVKDASSGEEENEFR